MFVGFSIHSHTHKSIIAPNEMHLSSLSFSLDSGNHPGILPWRWPLSNYLGQIPFLFSPSFSISSFFLNSQILSHSAWSTKLFFSSSSSTSFFFYSIRPKKVSLETGSDTLNFMSVWKIFWLNSLMNTSIKVFNFRGTCMFFVYSCTVRKWI